MNLYFVTCQFDGVWRNFAYWADCADDATNQAIYDGATGASTCPTPAGPYYASEYHGPDFDGRKAWLVFDDSIAMMRYINSLGVDTSGLLYGIAADNYQAAIDFDPVPFLEKRVCITGLRSEADAHLDPGWDQ